MQHINLLIAIPLKRNGQLIGFVGVDDPTQVSRFAVIGDYIAVFAHATRPHEKPEGAEDELLDNPTVARRCRELYHWKMSCTVL